MRTMFFALVWLMLLVIPAAASTTTENPSKILSPYFLVQGADEDQECFPLKSTTVEANISGVIADVKVTQEYANTGTKPINARYIFPASTRAAVHGMRMTVGEDVVEARIEERQAAKKEFNDARAAGKSASLLQQHRPNVFSMDVANIMPGDTVSIELHYSELLIPEEGKYEFVFPTVVGPRYSTIPEAGAGDHQQWLENPYLTSDKKPTSRLVINVTLTAGMPIRDMACTTHETDVTWEDKSRARIALGKSQTNGGNRDFILEYRLTGEHIHTGLMLYQGEKENFFTLMVQPPARVTPDSLPPREYIFVVDVSGSMHGFPLETAKSVLRQLVATLTPADTFNVILFAASAQVLAPRSLPADSAHIAAAMKLIDAQRGGGGTELSRAVRKALALPRTEGCARSMVIITDGFIAAEKEVFELIAGNLNHSNVFAFGIGRSVNRYLIEGMAKAGQGEPFVVTEPAAALSAVSRFKAYVQSPVLTGIHVDFGTFDAYDVEPAVQADLFAQRPLILCGKWRGQPQGTIHIRGTAGEGPYIQSFQVAQSTPSDTHSALPYLWAGKRLSRLIDYASRSEDEDTKQQVTELGLRYQLLTRYTSFVAVHKKVRNLTGAARDVAQPLPLPKGVSNYAVGCRNVPEPDITRVLVMMVFVGILILWLRRVRLAAPARSRSNSPGDDSYSLPCPRRPTKLKLLSCCEAIPGFASERVYEDLTMHNHWEDTHPAEFS